MIGIDASLPVTHVTVFLDAESALRYATTRIGEWCVALPLCRPSRQDKNIFRCLVKGHGVSVVSKQKGLYNVISHRWPATSVKTSLSHLSVLGIWWKIRESALRQIESALTIVDLFGLPVWMDALSIDQENDNEKQNVIPEMGRIFSDGRHGFIDCTITPDVLTINEKFVKELFDIKDCYSNEEKRRRLKNVLESPWFSRCWMFQEELLTPMLMIYDPSTGRTYDFRSLQERCIQEFRYLHETKGYNIAKSEGWFDIAVSVIGHMELMQKEISWNLGNILSIRGKRSATEECDQINSLLGILNIKCNYNDLSTAKTLDNLSFKKLLLECSENGNKDTSWVAGEDPTEQVPHLSWMPSSPYVNFSTQAESSSIKWITMTKDGPQLLFYRAFDILGIVHIQHGIDCIATLSMIQDYQVDGEWIFEYCGIAFGADTKKDNIPMLARFSQDIFKESYKSWIDIEEKLKLYLPVDAHWRAEEFKKYLEGSPGYPNRFNSWIVFETPVRRIAVLAKILTKNNPQEVLFGFPFKSKYSSRHYFFPVMIVDNSKIRKRVGWVWPCVHTTLKGKEIESNECIRCISN